jgi:ABC-type glutathione transport system ATPase component
VRALDGVSFGLARGQSMGIVGESGSGKSTLLRTILRLTPQDSGTLVFDGADISRMSPAETKRYRRRVQPVFQDPYSTFNPRFSVGSSIAIAFCPAGSASGPRSRGRSRCARSFCCWTSRPPRSMSRFRRRF